MGRRKISDLFDSDKDAKQLNLESYGQKIKQYRAQKGLTAEDLARSLRVSLSTVRNWECGFSRPDLALLSRLFILLDVDPNEFFALKGVGHAFSPEEDRVIATFRAMDTRAQDDYIALGEAIAARHPSMIPAPEEQPTSQDAPETLNEAEEGGLFPAPACGVDRPE